MRLTFFIFFIFLLGCANKPLVNNIAPKVKKQQNLISVTKYTNFSVAQIEKTEKALVKITEIANSECFSDFMQKRGLIQTSNKTPAEVVSHIKSARVNVELIWYYKYFSKVHGYTYPNTDKIWLNSRYHTGTTICAEASNIFHEGTHKMGYGHDFKATKTRPYSVPYSVNAAVGACCRE